MRVARLAKTGINISLCVLLFLVIYLLAPDDDDNKSGARASAEDDYDLYMEENGIIELENQSIKVEDMDVEDIQDEVPFLKKGAEDRRKMMDELVIVIVTSDDTPPDDVIVNVDESLEAPSEVASDNDDVDVLRDNDVMIENVVIDRSEDLLSEINGSMTSLDDGALSIGVSELVDSPNSHNNHSSPFYGPHELLPWLKKPPTDRDAPGEFGHPFEIPKKLGPSVERQIEEGYRRYSFNVLASDIVSLHRNLGDKREEECKAVIYKRPLPTVSVILCYRSEAVSTLLRTIYSVLETVPAVLLQEVIVIDDADKGEVFDILKGEFKDLEMVKLFKHDEQLGVTKARSLGVAKSTGDVIAFLDSHCECYEGWMEPLLQRIKENRTVVALPIVEIINPDNFKFSVTPMQRVQRGGFDWTLAYRWIAPPSERFRKPKMDMTQPVTSPTMSGGVFAMDRKYFEELGGYDEGMTLFGGENLEMSFRIWMCGGRIEVLPCSHVGHVFKSTSPHDVPHDVILRNKRRVAEVWLDEYKALFFKRTPDAAKEDAGDVTKRVLLRKELQCKSFSWFVENVYPELYVPELNPRLSGSVCCTFGSAEVCLDTHSHLPIPGKPLGVGRYHPGQSTQYFEFTKQDELRQTSARDVCLASKGGKLEVQKCKFPVETKTTAPPSQQWKVNQDGTIMNLESKKCLAASIGDVWLSNCDVTSIRQKWKWK